MASDAASESRRGRPPVFSGEALRRAAGFSYARQVTTRRGEQDLVYRMFALAVLEQYCEAFPEAAAELGWLLSPRRRHVLLSELGRIAKPTSTADGSLRWNEEDVSRLVEAAFEISKTKPSTKNGVRHLRALRMRGPAGGAS